MLKSLKHTYLNSAERKVYSRLRGELGVPVRSPDEAQVLVDIGDTFCECVEQLAFARYFSEKFGLQAATYVPGFTARRRALHGLLRCGTNHVISRGYRLARANGVSHGLDAGIVDEEMLAAASREVEQFFDRAKGKQEVLDYRCRGVEIGIAIYDSFLRETMLPTIQLDSPRFREIAFEAFLILRAVERYFHNNNVKVVVLGHCVYNNWKIVSDCALLRDIQVFVTYNSRTVPLHDVNASRGLQTSNHSKYKADYLALDLEAREAGRKAGRELLMRRVSGELDSGLAYMSKSAYAGGENGVSVQIAPGKRVIVLMLHSFFDSPHIYKGMIFPDFLDWVNQTLSICGGSEMREHYDVLVKPHPNRFPQEDDVIASILCAHPHAKLLPPDTSNSAVSALRPACILTVYGTVAAEFSFLGIPVITCGDNPTSSFGFCFEAETLDDYVQLLQKAEELVLTEAKREEVAEFMFMHNLHGQMQLAEPYPFQRYRRHSPLEGHERIGNFQFDCFKRQVDAALERLDPPLLHLLRDGDPMQLHS